MRRRSIIGPVLALALVGAGCGSDDDTSSTATPVAQTAASMQQAPTNTQTSGSAKVTKAQAVAIARKHFGGGSVSAAKLDRSQRTWSITLVTGVTDQVAVISQQTGKIISAKEVNGGGNNDNGQSDDNGTGR
jgi:uncharacterized membrane protein YkoI